MDDKMLNPKVETGLLSAKALAKIKANTALAPPLSTATKVALARIFAGGSAQLVPLDDDALTDVESATAG